LKDYHFEETSWHIMARVFTTFAQDLTYYCCPDSVSLLFLGKPFNMSGLGGSLARAVVPNSTRWLAGELRESTVKRRTLMAVAYAGRHNLS